MAFQRNLRDVPVICAQGFAADIDAARVDPSSERPRQRVRLAKMWEIDDTAHGKARLANFGHV